MFRSQFWAGIGVFALGFSWLSFSHYRPWVSFQAELLAFTGIALIFAASLAQRSIFHWPVPALCIAATGAIPLLQYGAGLLVFVGDAWVSTIYLLAWAGAFALGYSWSRRTDASLAVEWAWGTILAVPAVLSAFIGLLQWAQLSEVLGIYALHVNAGDRPMGNVGQPNHLADLLVIGACAFAFLYERRRIGAPLALTALAFTTVVLAFTQSRAGLFGASLVACFLWAKLRQEPGRAVRLRSWHAPVWAALLWLVFELSKIANDVMMVGANRGIALLNSNSRDILYLQTWNAIFQAPWLGYGWNQSSMANRVGSQAYPSEYTFGYSHSVVLDLFAWVGLPLGALLVLGLVYWSVDRALRVRSVRGVLAMAALIPFGFHSLFEFPYAYAYFLLPAGLLAGLVEAEVARRSPVAVGARMVAIVAAAWVCIGATAAWAYLQVESDFRIVRFENLRTGRTPEGYEPPRIALLTHMEAMLTAARLRAQPGMSPAEIELLRKVAVRFPWGALGFRYATALALNGDYEGAAREMLIMRNMYGSFFYESMLIELRDIELNYPQLSALKLR